MVFSSSLFLVYFLPIFLILYYSVPRKAKNFVLLVSSIVFYSWGAPKFIFVIIGTTFLDFHLVKWMDSSTSRLKRRMILTFSVCMNLGLLIYFKYSNFFVENINAVLGVFEANEIHWTKLVLPIGISFYTFETMTYVVDVYRRVHKPLHNFWEYQLYIICFPKLIAGPIIRYHEIADQITDRSQNDNLENRITGFYRFVIGLAKKVLIANVMGEFADSVFKFHSDEINTSSAWLGILAYTFQIYFDFSGYSDMAIGIGKMIGFKFPENFNNPYISQGITEFWRRWHITLGAWMRNYLYIPLGGNKVKTKRRLYFNLWFVFLASGLWHGASWSFIIWGAYHGLFLVLERAGLSKFYPKIGIVPAVLLTFLIVLNGWVFFRVENVHEAFGFLFKMYSFDGSGINVLPKSEFIPLLVIATLFSFFALPEIGNKIQKAIYHLEYTFSRLVGMMIVSIALFIVSLSYITASGFNPFIYFRF
jgi:alginate O-acetyltransferase complex protein AlgI